MAERYGDTGNGHGEPRRSIKPPSRSETLEGVMGGVIRHHRVRARFKGLGFDGVSVPCDGETVRERMSMDDMDDIHAGEGEWERNGMNGVVWVRAGEGKR